MAAPATRACRRSHPPDRAGAAPRAAGQAWPTPVGSLITTDDVYDEFMSEFTAAMSGYTTGDPADPATAYAVLIVGKYGDRTDEMSTPAGLRRVA